MATKTPQPTHFVVGTENSNGKEAYVFDNELSARNSVTELIKDGFQPSEIIWIQGVKLRVSAYTYIEVESIKIG